MENFVLLRQKLCCNNGFPDVDPTKCERLLGKLIYIIVTQLDICLCVGVVSRYTQAPKQIH